MISFLKAKTFTADGKDIIIGKNDKAIATKEKNA
jgi:hypothetical protein